MSNNKFGRSWKQTWERNQFNCSAFEIKRKFLEFFYPPSSGIYSCVRTVYMVMCLQTWRSPAIGFGAGWNELRAVSVGFLFPMGSCSGVLCSVILSFLFTVLMSSSCLCNCQWYQMITSSTIFNKLA